MCHPGSRKQVAIGFLEQPSEFPEGILGPKQKCAAYLTFPSLLPSDPPFQECSASVHLVPIQTLPETSLQFLNPSYGKIWTLTPASVADVAAKVLFWTFRILNGRAR